MRFESPVPDGKGKINHNQKNIIDNNSYEFDFGYWLHTNL